MATDTAIQERERIDIEVTTGIYSKETLAELNKREKAIRTALSGIDKNMEKVAFNLYWIYSNKAYKAMGCESITDYALNTFDLGKTTAYSFINLIERFAIRLEDDTVSDKLDDKYKGYSFSKLSLLTDLSDEQIEELDITPDMSVRDIKKLLKKADSDAVALPDKKEPPEKPEDTSPDAQGTMTTKDDEVSVSEAKTNIDDDDSTTIDDDDRTAGYLIDVIINGERRPSTGKNTDIINPKYIEDTFKFHPEVEELIIYRKKT